MSVLSYKEINLLLNTGVVKGSEEQYINSASLDVTLGNTIMTEKAPSGNVWVQPVVSLGQRTPLNMERKILEEYGYVLKPEEFILAQTREVFYLPDNISAEYKLKSSMARIGLEHLNAGWCDAGWNGSVLTLELKNVSRFHAIHIKPGDKIGQMIFYEHSFVPEHASYRTKGSYNGHLEVTAVQKSKQESN